MENSHKGLVPFSRQNVVLPHPSKDALGSTVEYGLKDYKSQSSVRKSWSQVSSGHKTHLKTALKNSPLLGSPTQG